MSRREVQFREHRPVKPGCCPLCQRPMVAGPFQVDLSSGRCEGDGVVFFLENRQAQVLDALNRTYPNGLSKAALHREIYGDAWGDEPPLLKTIESYVSHTRSALAEHASGYTIRCSRLAGYVLVAV